jgi:hypothetical protein
MRLRVDSLVYHEGGIVPLGLRSENMEVLKRNALMEGHTGYLKGDKHWGGIINPAIIFFKGRASEDEIKALEKQGFSDLMWHWI